MPGDDRIITLVLVLQSDPIAESAGEMSQVAWTGGTQSAKNNFFLFFTHILSSKYKNIDEAHDHTQNPADESGHDQYEQNNEPVRPNLLVLFF